jgi:hypothetical protein
MELFGTLCTQMILVCLSASLAASPADEVLDACELREDIGRQAIVSMTRHTAHVAFSGLR